MINRSAILKTMQVLFLATTINYMDRQILGLLAPLLQKEIGWNEQQYGNIVVFFQAAYAIGQIGFGWMIDRKGLASSGFAGIHCSTAPPGSASTSMAFAVPASCARYVRMAPDADTARNVRPQESTSAPSFTSNLARPYPNTIG